MRRLEREISDFDLGAPARAREDGYQRLGWT